MTSSDRPAVDGQSGQGPAGGAPRRGSRRFVWLAAAILAAIAAYTAGWFWLAREVEARTAAAIAGVGERGASLDCTNRSTRGYPFRIGLFCDELRFDDDTKSVEMKGKGFRTAAQVYDPFQVVGEMDEMWLDYLGITPGYGLNAKALRFSALLDRDLPQRASFAMKTLSVDANPDSRGLDILLAAEAAEAHMRRNGADVDIAFNATDLTLAPGGGGGIAVPLVEADLTVRDGVRLAAEPPRSLRGTSLELRKLALTADGEAGVTVSGPVAVDAEGLVDATLQISVRKPQALAAIVAALVPGFADQIEGALGGMAILGEGASLPLSIEKSRARIAFITLGRIPPLR